MRDWLSHLVLSELYERRQRETISIEGCQRVRGFVTKGELASAVEYLIEDAPPEDEPVAEWFERELRIALEAWEADGETESKTATTIRKRLDAEDWAGAVRILVSEKTRRKRGSGEGVSRRRCRSR